MGMLKMFGSFSDELLPDEIPAKFHGVALPKDNLVCTWINPKHVRRVTHFTDEVSIVEWDNGDRFFLSIKPSIVIAELEREE